MHLHGIQRTREKQRRPTGATARLFTFDWASRQRPSPLQVSAQHINMMLVGYLFGAIKQGTPQLNQPSNPPCGVHPAMPVSSRRMEAAAQWSWHLRQCLTRHLQTEPYVTVTLPFATMYRYQSSHALAMHRLSTVPSLVSAIWTAYCHVDRCAPCMHDVCNRSEGMHCSLA